MLEAAIEGAPYTRQIYLSLRILCLIVTCREAEAEEGYREIDVTPKIDPKVVGTRNRLSSFSLCSWPGSELERYLSLFLSVVWNQVSQ